MFTYYSVSDAIARNQTEKLGELMENYFFSSFGGDCTVEKHQEFPGIPEDAIARESTQRRMRSRTVRFRRVGQRIRTSARVG